MAESQSYLLTSADYFLCVRDELPDFLLATSPGRRSSEVAFECLCKTSCKAPAKSLRRGLYRSDTGRANVDCEGQLETDLGRDFDYVSQLALWIPHVIKHRHSPTTRESAELIFKLKHRSSLPTDPCFGTIQKTAGQLLQLCEGQNVTQLQLEHGSKKARSDAQGLLSVRIEVATSTQARDNNARAAEQALGRLRPQYSDAGRRTMHSVHEATSHSQAASSSAAGSGTLGARLEVHGHPEASHTGSSISEDLDPHKATESSGSRETGLPVSEPEPLEIVRSDHDLHGSVRVLQPDEDPQHHLTARIASALAISPKLKTLAANVSQSTDVLVSLGTLLDKIQCIAKATANAMDVLAKVHPYADMAWKLLSIVYKVCHASPQSIASFLPVNQAYEQQKETDAAVLGLLGKMEGLYSFVDDIEGLPGKIKQLGRTLIRVLEQTTECAIFFREYTDRGFLGRLVGHVVSDRKKTISDLSSTLDQLWDDLMSGLQLHTAFVSTQTRDGIDMLLESVDGLVKSNTLKRLDPAKMNAADRPVCLPGTRQDLLKTTIEWLMTPSDENILWLHGAAGLGKSTLATTIAEYFRGLQRRGAFLFFDRNSPIESAPARVISTLAYQIAEHHGGVHAAVSAAIDKDPQLVSAPLASQFISLLSEPLSTASSQIEGPIIVILDALDECGDASSRRTLLNLLSSLDFAKLPRQFRFLITSRPDHDIKVALSARSHVRAIDLATASDEDIMFYISHETTKIYTDRHTICELPIHWPGEKALRRLVVYAAGLFIWAATAIKLLIIADDPVECLESMLSEERGVFTLHELYKTALLSACQWQPGPMTELYRRILGIIIISQVPLTAEAMADVLGIGDSGRSCRNALQHLGCVIKWSPAEPPRTLHKSFPDYLTDRSACGSEPWFIDAQEHQYALTLACLRIMNSQLHFNMCNLESSHIPNANTDLSKRIKTAIPPSLSYPCRFWGHHLRHVLSGELSVLPLIVQFFESKFLHWLEVLSLLGEVQVASQILLAVKKFVPVSDILDPKDRTTHASGPTQDDDAGLQAFAQDALKFVRVFAPAVAYSTPHIYVSCVPLAPPLSVIKQRYITSLKHTLVISGDPQYGWPALQQVYKGHTDWVRSAAFSPDGRRIASGSDDGSIHIWDAETGLLAVGPIQGDAGWILSVAFSPDGHTVASGSQDGTVCIWDAETGVLAVGPFEGHTGTVYSVAFSPDGLRLASGSDDRPVRMWDTETGVLAAGPFKGHTEFVLSVAFSPDGRRLASGSHDRTVLIWDLETGRHGAIKGHTNTVSSVAFSPDGLHVVSGSEDKTVRIWDAETGTLTAGPFEGHTNCVKSVAYSPDGLWVASGSDDQTIRIWSLQSGTIIQTFKGHTVGINSVAFSSDGQRIASASDDRTVRIWDAEAGPLAANTSGPSKGHARDINSVVFSPDGRRIASGSDDCTMCIWDVETGKLTGGPYEGHTDMVWSVAFSPDGRRVATGSADSTIRLWDVEMGSHVTLTGHTNTVRSVVFSPDGRKVVSGSADETICMWDSETGVLTTGPVEGHEDSVHSVVFSPDGRQVASGSGDRTVRVWTVDTSFLEARKFKGHTDGVYSVAFSLDGRKIASGSHDKTVRIWDIETGSHVAMKGHTDWVWSVAFSPDGQHVSSGSFDKTVRIWDVETGALIARPFREHGTRVFSVAFSPDGQRLASSGSSAIRVFDVEALHKQEKTLSLRSQGQADDGDNVSEGFSRLSQLQEDGWMVNPGGALLFYVPPDLREGLWWPHETAVITSKQVTRLDVSQLAHGADWAQCHIAE
ncbi:hypothetical protein HWV62_41709 [Athelia sp. TMB]|nr:hypothetical protein HWV62_41709 [Athelia sp. TMB]